MRYTFCALFIFLITTNLSSQKPADMINNPISLNFFNEGVGTSISSIPKSKIIGFDDLPLKFKVAFEVGHLVVIQDPDAEWQNEEISQNKMVFSMVNSEPSYKIKKAFIKNNYVSTQIPENLHMIFLIPKIFFIDQFTQEEVFDRKVAEDIIEYHLCWIENEKEISDLLSDINKLNSSITTKEVAITTFNSKITALNDKYTSIEANIKDLKNQFKILKEQPNIPFPKRIEYKRNEDYFIDIIENNLIKLDKIPYDPNQVALPYMQKEAIEALEIFYKNLNDDDLKELGVANKDEIKLISAARTPLMQCAIRETNPVAIGLFSTGHAYGVSFDLNFSGKKFDVKSFETNRTTPKDLNKLLKNPNIPRSIEQNKALALYNSDKKSYKINYTNTLKAWIYLNNLLNKAGFVGAGINDPNHYNLKEFYKNTKSYGDKTRLRMLQLYNNRMTTVRDQQLSKISDFKNRKRNLTERCVNLDNQINVLEGQIKQLEERISTKEKELSQIFAQIELRNREREKREREEREGRRGNDRERNEGDWEYKREEFHYKDKDRECYGERESYRDGRGNSAEREAVECRDRNDGRDGAIAGDRD